MATFLLAWELGRGSGHLVRLLPIAEGLTRRGHQVFAAVKDLPRAQAILPTSLLTLIAAPLSSDRVSEIEPALTFAHVLHNVGFGDLDRLRQLTTRWRTVFEETRPDLIAFDHSPTALLAARGLPTRRVLLGSGFFCPPDRSPLPNLRPWIKANASQLIDQERLVLDQMNTILRELGQSPLDRITQLYSDVDENFLTTLKELDHYRDRPQSQYWGAWTKTRGEIPIWPNCPGKRIYGYLKPFDGLTHLLTLLRALNHPTLIHCDGVDISIQREFGRGNLRFAKDRLDLETVGRECDLGILNGNHGTTIALLLAGKPTFQVPITLEQAMLADAVRRMGAGLAASSSRRTEVTDRLKRMLLTDTYSRAAKGFKARYADFDALRQQENMLNRIEWLAMV
jgi:hypothetical protein